MTRLHEWQASCFGAYLYAERKSLANDGSKIQNSGNLIYCAPTSGGKTLVAVFHSSQLFSSPSSTSYMKCFADRRVTAAQLRLLNQES